MAKKTEPKKKPAKASGKKDVKSPAKKAAAAPAKKVAPAKAKPAAKATSSKGKAPAKKDAPVKGKAPVKAGNKVMVSKASAPKSKAVSKPAHVMGKTSSVKAKAQSKPADTKSKTAAKTSAAKNKSAAKAPEGKILPAKGKTSVKVAPTKATSQKGKTPATSVTGKSKSVISKAPENKVAAATVPTKTKAQTKAVPAKGKGAEKTAGKPISPSSPQDKKNPNSVEPKKPAIKEAPKAAAKETPSKSKAAESTKQAAKTTKVSPAVVPAKAGKEAAPSSSKGKKPAADGEEPIELENIAFLEEVMPPEPKKRGREKSKKSGDVVINRNPEVIRKEIEAAKQINFHLPSNLPPPLPKAKPELQPLERTKFTEAELKEFRDLINKKLAEARNDYELLKDTLSHRDNNGTDDTSPTFKLLEDGSEVLSKEETTQLAMRQQKFIQNLENALLRIENKTYGICRATGQMISKERLRSVPHATLSIEAKRMQQN
jgi:RNA polymerase-binding transcription factor DksA